jgi:hypothetical protein
LTTRDRPRDIVGARMEVLAKPLAIALLLAIALPDAARAEERYVVAEGCPNEDAFWREVRSRSPAARSSTSTLSLRVVVTSTAGRVQGVLAIDERPPAVRTVSGARCSEVVSALALITALAFDRHAGAPPERPPPPAPIVPNAPRWHAVLGVHAAVVAGALPEVALTLPFFAELIRDEGPAVRIMFTRASKSASQLAVGQATFTWTTGKLFLCGLGVSLGDLTAEPCVIGEAGLLQARPSGVANAVDEDRPWLGIGASGRVRFSAPEPLFIEVEGGATVPIFRDRFRFGSLQVHDVAPLAPFLGAGFGIHFL